MEVLYMIEAAAGAIVSSLQIHISKGKPYSAAWRKEILLVSFWNVLIVEALQERELAEFLFHAESAQTSSRDQQKCATSKCSIKRYRTVLPSVRCPHRIISRVSHRLGHECLHTNH